MIILVQNAQLHVYRKFQVKMTYITLIIALANAILCFCPPKKRNEQLDRYKDQDIKEYFLSKDLGKR